LNFSLKGKSVGIVGMGNLGQALLGGLLESKTMEPENLWVANRSPGKVEKMVKKWGCHGLDHGSKVVEKCDVVILAMKPQDLFDFLESARNLFQEDQLILSLAAGVSLSSLRRGIPDAKLVRIMTNTPISVQKAVVGFSMEAPDIVAERIVTNLFAPLGHVVSLEEGDPFDAFTVGSSSGAGFLFEIMSYWQDWIAENGIEVEEARKIVLETFKGAADMALQEDRLSFDQLTDKVASKKGVTAAGLSSFRELELEGILRMSFNKALIRNKELGQS